MKDNRGLSLIEIIVVIGILTVILSFGMLADINAFKGDTLRSEQTTIVSTLQRARSHAMANMFESTYGVCYNTGSYVIFHDGACDKLGSDEIISANANITTTFSTAPIVFDRLTGKLIPQLSPATNEVDITVDSGNGVPKHIKVNNEGTINW